ncbi:carbohydrate ABC transporter permease [Ructibacterium gallinarum]|uniref:Carbohydrate ABC transporter permease n=1 Tax=Ructibacterium gallinarum TaxID=2779355 RepID=A0A9D5M112_9FIRM|nr:carbohydrate ABC transporter permease [Ructibacterium gallinarum]MBE5040305.1 carbohydrate ABC transporter permease [Ructibacterium gallinarum]
MKIKKTKSRLVFEVCNTIFLCLMVFITLYPLWYVVVASFSESNALMRHGGNLLYWPLDFTFDAYLKAFTNQSILSGYRNTLFIVVVGVIISMILSSVGAYFLSCRDVMFKKPVTILILFTMWFSGGLIPFYIAVRDIKLNGSLWSLIIPTAISTYNMIILRTAFDSVPDSLEESAYLDGAGHWLILFRIMLPLSKATIAVIALYYGVGYWNAWFNASIFLQGNTDKWPLQLVLRQILIANDTSSMTQGVSVGDQEKIGESIKYAVIVIATLPILCVYPFVQKYFVKGVMIGAVKG